MVRPRPMARLRVRVLVRFRVIVSVRSRVRFRVMGKDLLVLELWMLGFLLRIGLELGFLVLWGVRLWLGFGLV
jgi:hypothetical protein